MRQNILDAAVQISAEKGVLGLTVERVIRQVGISKGAFFHHFRSKEEMTGAMLESIAEAVEREVEARVPAMGSFAAAHVAVTFETIDRSRALMASMIAAVAIDPNLAEIVGRRVDAWTQRMIDEGMPPVRARQLRLALDGTLLSLALGTNPFTRETVATLRSDVERFLQPTEEEQLAELFRYALEAVEA